MVPPAACPPAAHHREATEVPRAVERLVGTDRRLGRREVMVRLEAHIQGAMVRQWLPQGAARCRVARRGAPTRS